MISQSSEVACSELHHTDDLLALSCMQTFPFQKDALEFAAWCADAPAADLRYLLSQADQVPYRDRCVCVCDLCVPFLNANSSNDLGLPLLLPALLVCIHSSA